MKTNAKQTQIENSEEKNPKEIDIYQHMKYNFHHCEFKCDCIGVPPLYCISCKSNVCTNCNYSQHKDHFLISKENTSLSPEEINEVFEPLVNELGTREVFVKCQELRNEMILNLENFTKELKRNIEEMQQKKIEQFNKLFKELESNILEIHNQIKDTKNQIFNYYNKYNNFFQYNPNSSDDDTNLLFLMNYDIINKIKSKKFIIETYGKNLEADIKNMSSVEINKYNQLMNFVNKIIKYNDKEYYETLKEDFKDNNIYITKDIRKDVSDNKVPYSPFAHFENETNKLNTPLFQDINLRIKTYSDNIEKFKAYVYSSFIKHKNYKGIEKKIDSFEALKSNGSDAFFSKRSINEICTSNYATEKSKIDCINLNNKSKNKINSKEDICLNDPVLRRYFAIESLDLYEQNFKTNYKQMQSSHADLLIKVDSTLDNEEDKVKVIEGSNFINIYDKKSQVFTKRKINLCRNPYGYANFPIGCRYLVLGEKIYITGGKDEEKEYANVLLYDIKNKKLKRIMDLNVPRSYHSIIYNDVFKTIMVFGGENENTCEIFDPLTSRWLFIPPLNFSRANPFIHFDVPRGIIYTLFGKDGTIVNGTYSVFGFNRHKKRMD